jgi:hypothetical protein
MNKFLESSFKDLYSSTVNAFPKTTRRQHAIDPIKIVRLEWVPYVGLKTLFIKGLAQNTENSKEYNPILLFKKINYSSVKGNNYIEIRDNNGKNYLLEKISENDVLVRCSCKDFLWRGNYADHLDHSLYGRKRTEYASQTNRPPVNPNNDPMVCKHVIKLYKVIEQSGIIN